MPGCGRQSKRDRARSQVDPASPAALPPLGEVPAAMIAGGRRSCPVTSAARDGMRRHPSHTAQQQNGRLRGVIKVPPTTFIETPPPQSAEMTTSPEPQRLFKKRSALGDLSVATFEKRCILFKVAALRRRRTGDSVASKKRVLESVRASGRLRPGTRRQPE